MTRMPFSERKGPKVILSFFLFNSFFATSNLLQLYPTLWDPMDYIVHQAPLSMGFSRHEYWSELPFPSPGDLPDLRIELTSTCVSCVAGRFVTR